jgi:hypothetical protein
VLGPHVDEHLVSADVEFNNAGVVEGRRHEF